MKHSAPLFGLLTLAAFVGGLLSMCATPVLASRNSSGTMSLYTPGNPVTTGSTISSSWANNTFSDMATELTNSLDRNGRGAMLAQLQCYAGSVSAPGLSFSSEANSGLYRNASHDIRMSVNGVDQVKWTTSGLATLTGLTATNTGTGAGITATGGTASGATGGVFTGGATNGTGASATGVGSGTGLVAIGGASGGGASFLGNGTAPGLRADAAGTGAAIVVGAGGLQVGSSGTVATASYGATYNLATGTIVAGTCSVIDAGTSHTLTGVATGGVCSVSTDAGHGFAYPYCYVSGANAVVIEVCNPTGSNISTFTDNYRVRVWQP